MSKQRQDEYKCPLEVTMEIIGGKYKGVIIGHLIDKTLRYNELQKLISHIYNFVSIRPLPEWKDEKVRKQIINNLITQQHYLQEIHYLIKHI